MSHKFYCDEHETAVARCSLVIRLNTPERLEIPIVIREFRDPRLLPLSATVDDVEMLSRDVVALTRIGQQIAEINLTTSLSRQMQLPFAFANRGRCLTYYASTSALPFATSHQVRAACQLPK